MSFLEAKTVKTFIGLVVDVALLLRGNGNDFEDDDAVTRVLLERDAIVVIAHPPLLLNEPTEVKVVEDDPERSGDIIFFYNSSLSRFWISSSVTQKKEKSVNLSLALSLSLTLFLKTLCVCVRACVRACVSACVYPSLRLSSLVSPTLSLVCDGTKQVRGKGLLGGFLTTNFFFLHFLLRVSNPNAFEERASLSLDVPHDSLALLQNSFCVVSRRNITRGIYTTRVSVSVCVCV